MRKKWTRRFRTNVPQPIRLTAASAKFGIEAGLSEFNTPNCGNRGDKSSNGTIFLRAHAKKNTRYYCNRHRSEKVPETHSRDERNISVCY